MTDPSQEPGSQPTAGGFFVAPTPEALQGVLPGYEVFGFLGQGGMGAVYQAKQVALDRVVAIKVLPLDPENDTMNFAERFQREAQAMAKFLHSRIVAVFDFGKTEIEQTHTSGMTATVDLLYIVIEFVEGTDLSKVLAEDLLPPSQVINIFTQICDALSFAHSHGIVHRDIKPANIMLDIHGNVKVADFGLAKLTGDSAAAKAQLTLSGTAMGTPDYVAPEVLEMGTEPDHRVDIYALGVMLYQMLTGKVPRGLFRSPTELIPGLDPRLEEVIEQAMQADPDHRYQTVEEFWTDLDAIRTSPQQADPSMEQATIAMEKQPSSRVKIKPPEGSTQDVKVGAATHEVEKKRAFPWKTILIGAGALIAAVAGAFFFLDPDEESVTEAKVTPPAKSLQVGEPRERLFTMRWSKPVLLGPNINDADAYAPTLTEDGKLISFMSYRGSQDRNADIWAARRNSLEEPFGKPFPAGPKINTSHQENFPELSSDGLELIFSRDHTKSSSGRNDTDLWITRRESLYEPFGDPEPLGPMVNTELSEISPDLSHDGLTLHFWRRGSDGLMVARRPSREEPFGEPRVVGQHLDSRGDGHPSLTRDGLTLLFTKANPRGDVPPSILQVAQRSSLEASFGTPVDFNPRFESYEKNPAAHYWSPDFANDGKLLALSHQGKIATSHRLDQGVASRTGEPIDLLAAINLEVNPPLIGDANYWKREDTGYRFVSSSHDKVNSALVPEVSISGGYDLDIEFHPHGEGMPNVVLPIGSAHIAFACGRSSPDGRMSGFEILDGFWAADASNSSRVPWTLPTRPSDSYLLRFRVRDLEAEIWRVECLLNGELHTSWQGDVSEVRLSEEWQALPANRVGLMLSKRSPGEGGAFRSVTLTPNRKSSEGQ